MSLKVFWKENKISYMWASILFVCLLLLLSSFKSYDLKITSLITLCALPIIFIFGFGMYEFTGGDKWEYKQ